MPQPMPRQPIDGSRPLRCRRRLTPVRRIRHVVLTSVCAGATLLGGSLSAQAEQRLTNTTLRSRTAATNVAGHGQHYHPGACVGPHCPAPSYSQPFLPYYGHGEVPDYLAPPQPPMEGQGRRADDQDGAGQERDSRAPTDDFSFPPDMTAAPAPSAPSLSGATGTPTAPASAAPNAIGDFFGIAHTCRVITPTFTLTNYDDESSIPVTPRFDSGGNLISVRNPITGQEFAVSEDDGEFFVDNGEVIVGRRSFLAPCPTVNVVGRIKATENNSPIPQDRVFFDYTYYHNVPLSDPDIGVVRMVPGIERTFLDGMMSWELRMPVAQTLDSQFIVGGPNNGDSWEAGNLYVAVKTLLYNDDRLALAAGLGITTPTANDLEYVVPGVTTVVVQNDAVHLLPYIAAQAANETFFSQAYAQIDVDTNGNPIEVFGTDVGVLQDQTFLYLDGVLGAWLYDNPLSDTLVSIAGVTELHYSRSLENADGLVSPLGAFGGGANDTNILTGTLGLHLMYAGGARVTFGYGVPLTDDRFADGEFRLMLNWGPALGGVPSLAGR